MPELPEVETVRQQLIPNICGKTIQSVEVFHNKTVNNDTAIEDALTKQTIRNIDRIGKLLIISFAGQTDLFLLAHLKMTGQFFYQSPNGSLHGGGHQVTERDVDELPGKHTRLMFTFSDTSVLYFNDMRLFGYVKRATAEQVKRAKAQYGPEPTSPTFPIERFVTQLRKRNTTIKAALLNQSLIAGLGNIYVDETLFTAGVRPTRNTARITKTEARTIAHTAGTIMNKATTMGGTTFQHFVDTGGRNGNYTDQLRVFGKQNTPCCTCGTLIIKTRVAGRGTHYCPHCQT